MSKCRFHIVLRKVKYGTSIFNLSKHRTFCRTAAPFPVCEASFPLCELSFPLCELVVVIWCVASFQKQLFQKCRADMKPITDAEQHARKIRKVRNYSKDMFIRVMRRRRTGKTTNSRSQTETRPI